MSRLRFIVLVLLATSTVAYYVPGTYPREYRKGEVLQAQVSSLSSIDRQLSYDYYTMPFCKPPDGELQAASSPNLGSNLQGVTFRSSPYSFTMLVAEANKVACQAGYQEPLTRREAAILTQRIRESYRVNIVLDNLPATDTRFYDLKQAAGAYFVRPGHDLGYIGPDGKAYVYNHLTFKVLVHASNGKYSQEARERMTEELAESIDARKLLQQQAPSLAGSEASDETAAEAVPDEPLARSGGEGASVASDALPRGAVSNTSTDSLWVVIGLQVLPCSIQRDVDGFTAGEATACSSWSVSQEVVEGARIVYTYDVFFSETPVDWPSRWDGYLAMPGGKVHWFSVWNNCLTAVVLAFVLAHTVRGLRVATQSARAHPIPMKSLQMPSAQSARALPAPLTPTRFKEAGHLSSDESVGAMESELTPLKVASEPSSAQSVGQAEVGPSGSKEEASWELASDVVFHPPPAANTLAALVGSGVHILCTTGCTLVLAALSFCSSASWGSLLTTLLVMYVLAAPAGGLAGVYALGIMQRSYDGWMSVCKQVSALFTGVAMLAFTLANLAVLHTGSTLAVPAGTYLTLLLTWLLVIAPMTFLGGRTATQLPIPARPEATVRIPHHRPWAAKLAAAAWLQYSVCSVLPFAAMFVELYFAMVSAWLGFYYSLFGFALLAGCLTVMIVGEASALCTYARLSVGDHGWWWGSFHRGTSVTITVASYALSFLVITLSHSFIGFLPVLIYTCYMSVILLAVYLAMGTIGVVSSYAFLCSIYSREGKAGCRVVA